MRLKIKNLSKTYGNGVKALQGVSLEIETGMFGLLGQNGAGKSTLMCIIATLQTPDTGSILFDDIDIIKQPEKLRQVLGYLPQEFGVYPNTTAEELLLHLAQMKGIQTKSDRKEQVAYLLEKVNLYDVRKKRLDTYSGGMKQRFGIAQALLGNPKLLIVDEPTAGLDPLERNRFYNLLASLGEKIVVVLSTHIVEDVSTLCNDMAIIGSGKVLLGGSPSKLEKNLEGNLWEKQIPQEQTKDYEKRFNVISSYFHLGEQRICVLSDTQPEEGFIAKPPSLESVYFKVLKDLKR